MKNLFYTLALLLPVTAIAAPSTGAVQQPAKAGASPISFIENKGQVVDQHGKPRRDIDYKLEANGVVMFAGDGQLHYQWFKDIPFTPFKGGINPHKKNSSLKGVVPKTFATEDVKTQTNIYRLDVELLGANRHAAVIATEKQSYYENYYLPASPNGATAYSYKKITYKNVYPNIDWVLYVSANAKSVKYDFVVHPGGNPADIRIQYNGATRLEVRNGALTAITPYGSITEEAPYSYYANSKEEVATTFVLNSNVLSYSFPNQNAKSSLGIRETEGLIIDPSLKWATYYGGSGAEDTYSMVTDTTGASYICGATASTANIATTGTYQTTYGGGSTDGFVAKFDINGNRIWATYYGGSNTDRLMSIAYDGGIYFYLSGETQSSGLSTIGAHQTTLSGGTDALLVKLDANGSRQWATYYGGINGEFGGSVACDPSGNVYMGGASGSSSGIATSGAFKTTQSDYFYVKFNSAGVRQWGTYYDGGSGVYCDPFGNVYFYGNTTVTTGMATAGAHQTSIGGTGAGCAFIARFTAAGARLWGTYYGGSSGFGADWFYDMLADNSGNIYMGGRSGITTGIATTGAHQTTMAGSGDGMLIKFSNTGTRIWGTYYGGTNQDDVSRMTIDPKENIYISGITNSTGGIATTGAYKTTLSGFSDDYIAIFTTGGVRKYGTYYGGPSIESAVNSRALGYAKGRLCLGSSTVSSTGIATAGAYQTTWAGGRDAYIVQFEVDSFLYIQQPFTDTVVCSGDTLSIPYGVTPNLRSSNVFTFQLSNSTGSFATPTTIGTVTGNTAGKFNWVVPSSITSGSGYRVRVTSSGPVDTAYEEANIKLNPTPVATANSNTPVCSGNTLNLTGSSTVSGVTWSWAGPGGYSSTTQSPARTSAQTTYSGDYILTADMNGCIGKDTVTVLVKLTPATPTVGNNGPLCNNGILNLTANSTTPGVSYNWSGPGSFTSTTQNPTINPATTANSGLYTVYAELNGCASATNTTTVSVVLGPTVNMYPSPNDTICVGNMVTFTANPVNPGSSPQYQWLKNGSPIAGATALTYTASGVIDGDKFTFLLTPGAGAACTTPVNSNSITMTVVQYTMPIVDMTGDTVVWPGVLANFQVTTVSGGTNPKYLWKVNGNNIVGATSNTWATTTLNNNDQVCVVMTPSFLCPSPATATACHKMRVKVGVENIANEMLKIYPNPANEMLYIEGIETGTNIQLTDVLGRVVYSTTSQVKGLMSIPTKELLAGNYVLQLVYADGTKDNVKVVKE